MQPFRKILLATDLRPSSRDVVRAAKRLGQALSAQVRILHVASDVSSSPARDQSLREVGRGLVDEVVSDFGRERVTVDGSEVVSGSVVDSILQTAERYQPDLIVMGAGEPGADGRVTTGPITESVMQHTRTPVLAVRAGDPPLEFRKFLCPTDGSPNSIAALKHAVEVAKAFGAALSVLMVVPQIKWFSTEGASTSQPGDANEPRLVTSEEFAADWINECARMVDTVDFGGVSWTKDVRIGESDKEIVAAATEGAFDLLFLGATGRSGIARVLMGSTSRRVIRRLPCSLVLVHHGA